MIFSDLGMGRGKGKVVRRMDIDRYKIPFKEIVERFYFNSRQK